MNLKLLKIFGICLGVLAIIFAMVVFSSGVGYFESNEFCTTKTEGIFVAGDCRSKTIRQVVTAAADGAIAATAACRYLEQ